MKIALNFKTPDVINYALEDVEVTYMKKYVWRQQPKFGDVFKLEHIHNTQLDEYFTIARDFKKNEYHLINLTTGYIFTAHDLLLLFTMNYAQKMSQFRHNGHSVFAEVDTRCIKIGDYLHCKRNNDTYLVSKYAGAWTITNKDGKGLPGFKNVTTPNLELSRIQKNCGGGVDLEFVNSFERSEV